MSSTNKKVLLFFALFFLLFFCSFFCSFFALFLLFFCFFFISSLIYLSFSRFVHSSWLFIVDIIKEKEGTHTHTQTEEEEEERLLRERLFRENNNGEERGTTLCFVSCATTEKEA